MDIHGEIIIRCIFCLQVDRSITGGGGGAYKQQFTVVQW